MEASHGPVALPTGHGYPDCAENRLSATLLKLGYDMVAGCSINPTGYQSHVRFRGDPETRFYHLRYSQMDVRLFQDYRTPQSGSLLEGIRKGAETFFKARGVDGPKLHVRRLEEDVPGYDLEIMCAGHAIGRADRLRAHERVSVLFDETDQVTERNVRAVVKLMEIVGKIGSEESQQYLSKQWQEKVQPAVTALSGRQNDWAERLLKAD